MNTKLSWLDITHIQIIPVCSINNYKLVINSNTYDETVSEHVTSSTTLWKTALTQEFHWLHVYCTVDQLGFCFMLPRPSTPVNSAWSATEEPVEVHKKTPLPWQIGDGPNTDLVEYRWSLQSLEVSQLDVAEVGVVF